jgi:hypothetical protein
MPAERHNPLTETVLPFIVALALIVVLVSIFKCATGHGTFEWTFDGQHHVLALGDKK